MIASAVASILNDRNQCNCHKILAKFSNFATLSDQPGKSVKVQKWTENLKNLSNEKFDGQFSLVKENIISIFNSLANAHISQFFD